MPQKREKADEISQVASRYGEPLRRCALLKGLDDAAAQKLLFAVGARVQRCAKDGFFIIQGDEHCDIFLLLCGACVGEHTAENGATAAINEFEPGDVFGDLLSGSGEASPVSVRALCECTALRFSFESLLADRGAEHERAAFVRNFVFAASHKYFALTRRIELLCLPRMRERILRYLEMRSPARGGWFFVEHDRAAMAAYLGCERSALSRELARLKGEGLIDYRKNSFCMINAKI